MSYQKKSPLMQLPTTRISRSGICKFYSGIRRCKLKFPNPSLSEGKANVHLNERWLHTTFPDSAHSVRGWYLWKILWFSLWHFTRQKCELTDRNGKEIFFFFAGKSLEQSNLAWRCKLMFSLVLACYEVLRSCATEMGQFEPDNGLNQLGRS